MLIKNGSQNAASQIPLPTLKDTTHSHRMQLNIHFQYWKFIYGFPDYYLICQEMHQHATLLYFI